MNTLRARHTAPAVKPLPTSLQRYHITDELGRGGMGVVYEATDTRLNRTVALKFLPDAWSTDAGARKRFVAEARAAAALEHRNICTIYNIDATADGRLFIVMPRYRGLTLRQRLRAVQPATGVELSEVVEIGAQIADALDAAHTSGIVHGDIKPGNVWICPGPVVKLLDFGLASHVRIEDHMARLSGALAGDNQIFGTVDYMAPERILALPPDTRSDLFSLGVVLYEMASNRLPFAGSSPAETIMNVLDRSPRPLEVRCRSRLLPLKKLIDRALAKDAQDRFQTAAEFREALMDCAGPRHNTTLKKTA